MGHLQFTVDTQNNHLHSVLVVEPSTRKDYKRNLFYFFLTLVLKEWRKATDCLNDHLFQRKRNPIHSKPLNLEAQTYYIAQIL